MKVCSLSIISILACYGVEAVTFEEAVVAAYNNNNGWFASQTEKKIADEAYTQAKMMFLPNVSAAGTSSRAKSEFDQYGGMKYDTKSTRTRMGLTVTQNLFNGFSTTNTMEANSNSAKAAFHKLKFEEQRLIISVLEAYTSIWAGRQKVEALKKKEENLKNTLDSQDSSLEAGVGTPSEVALASANYQKAIYERINAETELFSAESDFEKLTGLKADKNIELPNLNITLPDSLEKLIAQAMNSNHSILYYKLTEQAAINNLNATRGKLTPSCDLTLQASRDLNKQRFNNSENNYIASVEVSVPVFANPQSGNTYSAIEIANQNALKAKFTAQDTVLEIKKECVVNWNAYISANAMIQASRSAVKSAELSSESNLEESALGLKSNTDVWVKENQLLESRIDLANSQKQKMVTTIKLFALTGNLSLYSVVKSK